MSKHHNNNPFKNTTSEDFDKIKNEQPAEETAAEDDANKEINEDKTN